VQPGDTIVIDGGGVPCPKLSPGHDCGMVYNSTLSVQASGAPGAFINIVATGEPGRNGGVIIDGGLTSWSRCGEYAPEPTPPAVPNGRGTRDVGIALNSAQFVSIDGGRWGGIEVRNHTRYGLDFGGSAVVVARYLKIHHNTHPSDTSNGAAGVTQGYNSHHVTLARSTIFRNEQDAIRLSGDFVTISENFIHDQYCNHPDGIQAFVPTGSPNIPDDAGEMVGLLINRNVFERIGLQAVFLGENGQHQSWVTYATITNNLFVGGEYMIKSKHGSSHHWNVNHNTFVGAGSEAVQWCCAEPGAQAPMTVSDNIFVRDGQRGSAVYLNTGGGATAFVNNCVDQVGHLSGNLAESGTTWRNPWFIDGASNWALQGDSPCAGKGASVFSAADLVATTGP
jgi:hypothetical protein